MKILIATIFPLPGGGIWSFVSHLHDGLVAQGHSVDIICSNHTNTQVLDLLKGNTIELLPFRPVIERKLRKSIPKLIQHPWVYHAEVNRYQFERGLTEFDLSQYDLIHCQDVLSAVSISRMKPSHTPMVTSIHGFLSGAIFHQIKATNPARSEDDIWNSFVLQYYARLEKIGYDSSSFLHTSSRWMQGILLNQYSVPSHKIMTFNYGVPIEQFPAYPGQRSSGKCSIVAISRLVYLKGLHHLLESLEMLSPSLEWECQILGEGEMQDKLMAQARQLGIESKVSFLGNRNDVVQILQMADVLVIPSLQENQPFAVIEAQLMGVPVIASNAGGLPEMVEHQGTGLIVEKGNSLQLSMALEHLIRHPAERDRMGLQAWKHSREKWGLSSLIENAEAFYQSAMNMNT
ncbi:glycosyltransferase involved in cell wall biosynthesis [Rossellomorea marisflavi]